MKNLKLRSIKIIGKSAIVTRSDKSQKRIRFKQFNIRRVAEKCGLQQQPTREGQVWVANEIGGIDRKNLVQIHRKTTNRMTWKIA